MSRYFGGKVALYNDLSMLIISLPHHAKDATSGYVHVHSDGHRVLRNAHGAASLISAYAGEAVALIPHTRLSWLSVQFPPGSHGARLGAVLAGLLEDRVLEDFADLHCVVDPASADVPRTGGVALVAICNKAWMREVLAPLQASGLVVQRLLPELSARAQPLLCVMGTPEKSQTVLCHSQGVTLLPPNVAQWKAFPAYSAFASLQLAQSLLVAEPAMVERVEQLLLRRPVMQNASQRAVAAAAQSDWDFAQGEWAQGTSQRLLRWMQHTWQTLLHAPAWRSVRVGLACILVLQVVGLNAMAWREQQAIRQQKSQLSQILTTTFPSVSLVIDAPLQMQREVDTLQKNAGRVSSTDFEPVLATFASVLPDGLGPTQWHFANNVLRAQGMQLNDAQANAARSALNAKHLQLRQEANDVWVIQPEATP
jgi:general secretion pathway protein L